MKRFLCFLITLTVLITSIPFVAFAEDTDVLSFSYDETTLTATVTDCDESATTVAIPKTITKNDTGIELPELPNIGCRKHTYDNDCDTDCNVCGVVRTVPDHIYDNNCDTDCNICSDVRTAPHSYVDKFNATYHWQICSGCKNVINKAEHEFENVCDATCSGCEYTRNAGHTLFSDYDSENHWQECSVCFEKFDITSHDFENEYDPTCSGCEYTRVIVLPEISAVSMTLNNSLAYNVKVSGLIDGAMAKVTFTVGRKEFTVADYKYVDGVAIFTLFDIAPHLMTELITAEFTLFKDGVLISEDVYETTLEDYCLAVATDNAGYKQLVNAVLNYGAAAQSYKNYKLDSLANKTLSESEKIIDKKDYFDGLDKEYFTNSNSVAQWKSIGLNINSNADLKLAFETTQSVDGISVMLETEWGERVATLENCIIKQGDRYVFYFDGFNIDELDTIFLFTLYKDGKPISDTVSYSVESYAYRANTSQDQALITLMNALMNYCKLAKNY